MTAFAAGQTLNLSASQPVSFHDPDGSVVRIRLVGAGSGVVTLGDGTVAGEAIESIALSGTTGGTRLSIVSVGGRRPGTTIQDVSITKQEGSEIALDRLRTQGVDIVSGGSIVADGSVGSIVVRSIGAGAGVSVAGDLGSVKARGIAPNFSIEVGVRLSAFETQVLGDGGFISAGDRIDRLVVQGVVGRQVLIQAGAGGIGRLEVGGLEESLVTSLGRIGDVIVVGDMRGSSIVSNVLPGRDYQFGTFDDVRADATIQGGIGTVRVRGVLAGLAGSDQTYGIESANGYGIGKVIVAGRVITSETGEGASADGQVTIRPVGPTFGGSLDAPAYAVTEYMTSWGNTAPTYTENVAYTSDSKWENVRVINYTPSHYARADSSGTLLDTSDQPLVDTSFQDQIGTDFPYASLNYLSMAYLLGNPEITIYQDLKQLQNAGYTGVRLYGVPSKVAIATIEAAYKLSHEAGSKGAFYVDYEVDTPDLSKGVYVTGTVDERIQALYTQLTSTTADEGAFQTLHYVVNVVTPAVFSEVVPLVFFGHENLVQPHDSPPKLTDDNSSLPLLRWGINATRELLTHELGNQALPSVTTALLAGQAIQVSKDVHPGVSTLVEVILADPGAPIAYDNYPFQWGNAYANTTDIYLNDGNNIIDNAYPTHPNGDPVSYIDKTVVDGVKWESDEPKIPMQYTVADTVNKADLMWSMQWMVDRVNWVWGHLRGTSDGKVKQLVAETGWPDEGVYNDKLDGTGRILTGTHADAAAYYAAIEANGFKVGGVPVMYFAAYDEPVKNSNVRMTSENHYGVFRWTGTPKYTGDDQMHPLTEKFGVLGFVPTNYSDPNQPVTPQYIASASQGPRTGSYAYSINGGPEVIVPWYAGSNWWTDGQNGRTLFVPNPSVLLADGDKVTIRSLQPGNLAPVIRLKYDATTDKVSYDGDQPDVGQTLTQAKSSETDGSAAKIQFGFPWLHGGSNDYAKVDKFPRVFADWWAKSRGNG